MNYYNYLLLQKYISALCINTCDATEPIEKSVLFHSSKLRSGVAACRIQFSRCSARKRALLGQIAVAALAVALTMSGALKAAAQDQQVAAPQQTIPQRHVHNDTHASNRPRPVRTDQTRLPQIVVNAAKNKPKTKPVAAKPQPAAPPTDAATTAQTALDAKTQEFNDARDNNLLTKLGASSTSISRAAIERLPQADNTPLDKLILQFPGVSYNSAAPIPTSTSAANTPTRRSGSMASSFPKACRGSAPISTPISSATSRSSPARCRPNTVCAPPACSTSPAGIFPRRAVKSVSMAAAGRRSRPASTTAAASEIRNISSPRAAIGTVSELKIRRRSLNAIHDETQQGKFFGYASTMLDKSTRFSVISAASYSQFQIPKQSWPAPYWEISARNSVRFIADQ